MSESWQRILWVSWVAQILAIMGFSFVYPFLPLYVQHLGVHDQHAVLIWSGALYAGTTIALTIFAPLWGSVSDRYGRKVMVVRAMASGAVLICLMIFVQNPPELLVIRILQGVLTGSVAASQALVSSAVPRERLGFAMGLMQTALFTGSSIGPLLGGQLDVRFGYKTTFLIAAAMLATAALLVTFFVEEQFKPAANRRDRQRRSFRTDAQALLKNRQLALLITVLCAVQFGGQIVGPILPVFVQQLGGNSRNAAALAGNVFSIAGICSAVTAVLAGRLMDRRGHFRMVLIGATLAAALLNVPQSFVTSINQLYLLRGLEGLVLGGMLATSSTMLSLSTPPDRRGAAIGLSAGANAAGQALGQLCGSTIAGLLGIRTVFLFTAGVLALVCAAVTIGIRDPQADADEGAARTRSAAPGATPASKG
ncbi:MAG TPA: MFS transporter [Chloroflexota bacterium]|nr:MFS transporter [Chloroflexota bacterium]